MNIEGAGDLRFQTNGSDRMFISGGKVGIGTTNPGQMLQVGSRTGSDNQGVIRLANKTGPSNNEWDIGLGDATIGGTADSFYIKNPNFTRGSFVINNGGRSRRICTECVYGDGTRGPWKRDPPCRVPVGGAIRRPSGRI